MPTIVYTLIGAVAGSFLGFYVLGPLLITGL